MNSHSLRPLLVAQTWMRFFACCLLGLGAISAPGLLGQQPKITGPVCTKCTAGPQTGVPTRSLLIHVMRNNKPVRNAKVTVSDSSGFNSTFTTDETGAIQTEAPLGIYKVSAQKKTFSGTIEMPVSSGEGVIETSVSLEAPSS